MGKNRVSRKAKQKGTRHVWALRGQRLLRGLSLERTGWDVGKVSKWKVLLRPVREDAGITENG